MATGKWNPDGNRRIKAKTKLGEYTVEQKTRRRGIRYETRLNGWLIAIRDTEEEAILAAQNDFNESSKERLT